MAPSTYPNFIGAVHGQSEKDKVFSICIASCQKELQQIGWMHKW